ncbi:RlfB protein [Pseudomonas syringae]|uniref:RlfB protein n=1 Tax=Pseudomonas syringae TaxID=317 RepID=UPI000CD202E2|nr:RlfB protein [Pseudomonas syringae]MCH5522382.1 hypothetical protein [Pseudomonas syringae pv. lapsa]MDA3136052.1 RlfB protein [Pseudomonas syringae]POD50355.1 hypothetical protein BKM15_19565 [Pseudomonas syringae pv. syringae]
MFEEILDLEPLHKNEFFDVLYKYFHRDFVANKAYLNQTISIDPQSYKKEGNKEASFWHLTTRTVTNTIKVDNHYVETSNREPDYKRSERIEWIKEIITNHDHEEIKLFYHMETNSKKNIRLYLWAHRFDFVVILQKLGKSKSFLVTSFYIDQEQKRGTYEARFKRYQDKNIAELEGCEWF